MNADTLRRAAALMRKRAEAAIHDSDGDRTWRAGSDLDVVRTDGQAWVIADRLAAADAEHIASWHPAVALAVADWMDTAGADLWAHGPLCECTTGCDACDDNLWETHVRDALAVARAYLGESS